ncbi:MAG: hypothetical protein LBE55_06175 [Clostridiales bacterium]|jgi:uncharacterized membrane protein|nr:hypothetical protein [Clostridiales bacterium]
MNKSVFGLNENMAAALAYLGIFVTGIVILVLERENKFVRFAALQSVALFLPIILITGVLNWFGWIPILGWIIGIVTFFIGVLTFLAWLYLMLSAYKGQAVKVPIVGDICWEQVHK